MASNSLLVDLGGEVFKPKAEDPLERFEEYAIIYIGENRRITSELEKMAADPRSDEKIIALMTDGQRHLYVLSIFDLQVNNGGVYQFLFNAGHLAEEVMRSLHQLGAVKLRQALGEVLAEVERNQHLLNEARRIGELEFKRTGVGMPSKNAFNAYERGRLAVKKYTDEIQELYFPIWDKARNRLVTQPNSLRLEMCRAMVEYIAKNPGEFQIMRN